MRGKQFLTLVLACTLAAFSGAVVGPTLLSRALADPPCGNACGGGGGSGTVTSVTAADATVTQTGVSTVNPSFALNQGNTANWAVAQNFDGAAGSCVGAPATTYGACFGSGNGTTNSLAIVIGKQTGAFGGATSSASQFIEFFRNNGTSDSVATMSLSAGGTLNFQGSGLTAFSTNNNPFIVGTSYVSSDGLKQGAASGYGGTCTAVASTCTVTLLTSYTTPICWGNDQTSATAVAVKATASGTTLTLLTAGGTTDVLNGFCIGNPS